MRLSLIYFSLLATALTACAPYHYSDHRAAYCNELNSQIVFSGSTPNSRQADIQNAEQTLAQRDYDACRDSDS